MSHQLQAQAQLQARLNVLKHRVEEAQILSVPYHLYVKGVGDGALVTTASKEHIYYWYGFCYTGEKTKTEKMYNVVWGTYRWRGSTGKWIVAITSGCTYYWKTRAYLAEILKEIMATRAKNGYVYLGGVIKDWRHIVAQYLDPRRPANKEDPNRVDLSPEILSKTAGRPALEHFYANMLTAIREHLEHSLLTSRSVGTPCPQSIPYKYSDEDDYDGCESAEETSARPECAAYYHGSRCYREQDDPDYVNCDEDLR